MTKESLPLPISLLALALALLSLAGQIHWGEDEAAGTPSALRLHSPQEQDPAPIPKTPSESESEPESTEPVPREPDPLADRVARLTQQVDRLTRLIQASGLEQMAALWNEQPGGAGQVLEQMGKEAASRAQFESRVETLRQQAAEIQDRDYLRYGPVRYRELETLYQKARPGRGPQSEDEKQARTEALQQMLEAFPEAYQTGVAVAEQALQEALNGNLDQVEAYLETLSETNPHTNFVTEQGLEAIPTIQTFLARKYIEQGRTEEAAAILDQLAQEYPESLIVEPGPGNAPSPPRTAREIADELHQQLLEQDAAQQ